MFILFRKKDKPSAEGIFANAFIPEPPIGATDSPILPIQILTATVFVNGLLLLWLEFGDGQGLNAVSLSVPLALSFALVLFSLVQGVRRSSTLVIMGSGAVLIVHLLAFAVLIFGH